MVASTEFVEAAERQSVALGMPDVADKAVYVPHPIQGRGYGTTRCAPRRARRTTPSSRRSRTSAVRRSPASRRGGCARPRGRRPALNAEPHGHHRGRRHRSLPDRRHRHRQPDGAPDDHVDRLGGGRRWDVDGAGGGRHRRHAHRRRRHLRCRRRRHQRRRLEPLVVRHQHVPGAVARRALLRGLLPPAAAADGRRDLHAALGESPLPVADQPLRADRIPHRQPDRGLRHRRHRQHPDPAVHVLRRHGVGRHLRHLRLARRALGHRDHQPHPLRRGAGRSAGRGPAGHRAARGLERGDGGHRRAPVGRVAGHGGMVGVQRRRVAAGVRDDLLGGDPHAGRLRLHELRGGGAERAAHCAGLRRCRGHCGR